MAKATGEKKKRAANPDTAARRIVGILAPFDKATRKNVVKSANAMLRLAAKLNGGA